MSNRLFFNAREWSFNDACDNNVGERCFINGIDGGLVEVYTIGDWNWNWSEIVSKTMTLDRNTEYSFCFWLNGGENDRNNEVCQLRVVFDNDYDGCLIYKLNRGYIKPVKRYNGWELYDIKFSTGDNDLTQLRFVAMTAYMTVQPAKEPEAYAELEDALDEFDDIRPQRHNIVFEDGWPKNTWYSTKELEMKKDTGTKSVNNSNFGFNGIFQNGPGGSAYTAKADFSQLMNDIRERVRESMMGDIDIDEIVDEIKDDIDIDDIKDEIIDQINVDSLRDDIKNGILKKIKFD